MPRLKDPLNQGLSSNGAAMTTSFGQFLDEHLTTLKASEGRGVNKKKTTLLEGVIAG